MSHYVSSFHIIVMDQIVDRGMCLFSIKMKVVMNQDSFNEFVNIANDSLSELLNRFVHNQGVIEGGYSSVEQVYALDEAYQRIRNLFGEDADVSLDSNMVRYGMENAVEQMSNYIQPIIEFQISAFPQFEFVQLVEGRFNEIQDVFLRTHILA